MKPIIHLMIFLLIMQITQAQKGMFVRIADKNNVISHRGFLKRVTDSSLTITRMNKDYEIPINKISKLKLRRSFGHTVLLTSLITGGTFAIIGAATADPSAWIFGYTAGEGVLIGIIGGSSIGGVIGSIIAGTRKRPVYNIDMNTEQWIKVKESLKAYLPIQSN